MYRADRNERDNMEMDESLMEELREDIRRRVRDKVPSIDVFEPWKHAKEGSAGDDD